VVCDLVGWQVWGLRAGRRGVMYGLGDSSDVVCLHVVFRLPSFWTRRAPPGGGVRRGCSS
jgi:hypothetical protein